MLLEELLLYLFDGQPHLLTQPITTWLTSSRRFVTFVTTFRDKIRKKLRVLQDPESLLDLRLELETAYLLLQERPLRVVYEPLQPGKVRAPDYAVTFTTSLTFMLEVTRIRTNLKSIPAEVQPQSPGSSIHDTAQTTLLLGERLTDTICSKLGQLLPQRSNVLLVGAETLSLTQRDLLATMLHIRQRAERNDHTLLQRHHFGDRGDFFNHFQRLSEILVRRPHLQAGEPLLVWVNPQAKHPLPSKVRTVLYRSHSP